MSGGNKKFIFKMHNNETPHGAGYRSQGRDRSRSRSKGQEAGERSEQKASGTQSLDKVSRAGEQGEKQRGSRDQGAQDQATGKTGTLWQREWEQSNCTNAKHPRAAAGRLVGRGSRSDCDSNGDSDSDSVAHLSRN